jgi:ammonium transporter, Amt family
MLTWTMMDIIFYRKPSIIGAINGMITGLVGITPAAGFVAGWGAIVIGACTGTIPWVSMNIVGKRWSLFTHHIDDALGITHTHMVAGALGGFLTGLFATVEGVYAFGDSNYGGAIEGNGRQVWVQIVGALFIFGWNIVWTSLIMMFIKYVCRIPLRMSEEEMLIGDDAIHGEEAYCFTDDVTGLVPTPSVEARAGLKLDRIHAGTDYKGQSFLEGRTLEEGNGSNNTSTGDAQGTSQAKENGTELKLD